MKKLLAILCVVMLVLTCSISVFAEGEGPSIVISSAEVGKTYTAYKMLDLKYSGDAYYYTVADGWEAFFTGTGAGAGYVNIDSNPESKAVTWKNADAGAEIKASEAAALAAEAIKYVNAVNTDTDDTNNIPAAASDAATSSTHTLNVSDLGYYLVDSNLGSICSLNTTDPIAEITEKNSVPTVDKKVEENGVFDSSNTADIGDIVNFKSTITVGKGFVKCTWYDKMENLDYVANSLKVTFFKNAADTEGDEVAITEYDVETNVTVTEKIEGVDTDVIYDIVVTFDDDYCATLAEGNLLVITYSAKLNANAVVGDDGNPNIVHITYGENNSFKSEPARTTTKTFSFDLVKTDSNGVLLAGADFKLYAADGTTEIPVVPVDAENCIYRVAVEGETGVKMITNASKYLTIKGLDSGKYYLKEETVPTGYNPIAPVEVNIVNANIETSMEGTTWVEGNGGVHIINNTGNILPETGGMGTTLFIVIGSIAVLITGVVLVARKRMSKYVA